MSLVVQIYHWLRQWSGPTHGTMWVEVQAIATLAAFAAAFWYATIARRQMLATTKQLVAATRQLEITENQLRLSEREFETAQLARWQDNKPIVVLDRRDHPDRGEGNYGFVLSNIGGGFAVNVFQFDSKVFGWHSLGGLAAGEERPVPAFLQQKLTGDDPFTGLNVLVAEGAVTRTRRWNPTLNVITPKGGFVHALRYPMGDDDNLEVARAEAKLEIADYLAANRASLFDALETLRFSRGQS